ncbi:MAG: hypothetical protein JXA42_14175, partial [Anaerolineales bacterium]|nr:hypothetical protein [Anaerolineales bacterium]
ELARIVKNENCGVIVERPTCELLAKAMQQLYDPAFRATLAENARQAGMNKYNWSTAEATLYNVYQQLEDET